MANSTVTDTLEGADTATIEEITENRTRQKMQEDFRGEYGEALIQNVFDGNDDQLGEKEFIKFELLMPDKVTTKYISFTKDATTTDSFKNFLEEARTTPNEMSVMYETIPAIFIDGQWYISFSQDKITKFIRNSRMFTIMGNGNGVWATRWYYLMITILCTPLFGLTYLLGDIAFGFILWFSLALTPAFMHGWGASGMYAHLVPVFD